MRRNTRTVRANKRRDILRELAADGAVSGPAGRNFSRAAEAVDALRRIQEGTYGVCTDCRRKIPAPRLRVKPEATRCVPCQSDYEGRTVDRSGAWRVSDRRSA